MYTMYRINPSKYFQGYIQNKAQKRMHIVSCVRDILWILVGYELIVTYFPFYAEYTVYIPTKSFRLFHLFVRSLLPRSPMS